MHRGCYCSHLSKVVYPGNRCFLPQENVLRQDSKNFPDHSEDTRERPQGRNFKEDIMFHSAYDKAKNMTQKARIATGTGCRNTYVLTAKNASFNRVEQTVPDAMHTIAVQMKHILRCLAGKYPEDGLAVRIQEKAIGRFKDSWPTGYKDGLEVGRSKKKGKSQRESSLPQPPFGLNNKQMQEADRRAKQVIIPFGDSFTPGPIFAHISRLNSFQLKEVCFA